MKRTSIDVEHLRRAAERRASRELLPGEQLCLAFDTKKAPCGCARYLRAGVPCTPVAYVVCSDGIDARCLTCDGAWTFAQSDLNPAENGIVAATEAA